MLPGESVRRWLHRFSSIFSVEERFRRAVAVDETVVKMHGFRVYIWSALDVDSGEVLAVYASWSRNILIAMKFVRMVLDRCLNKPLVIVDRGPWYRWALDRLGLKYQYQRFGVRNVVEKVLWILEVEDREILQQHKYMEDSISRRLCKNNSNNKKPTYNNKNSRRCIT